MTIPLSDRVLLVADLVDRPGASRPVDLALPVPDGLELPLAAVTAPLRLTGVLESVVDGLLLRGSLRSDVELSCARCLTPVLATVTAEVVELFSDPATVDPHDEVEPGYELVDARIDVDTLLRDALVPALPQRPLCLPGCRGLCPDCGADRNVVACTCAADPLDPRWTALQGLRLGLHGTEGGGR